MAYVVRSSRTNSPTLMKELQQAVWSVNSNLPLSNVRTLDQIRASSMAQTSFALSMLAIAAGVALLLGIVGIYGVIAYIAAQRTREIGIRMALGAQAADVSRLFVRHGLWLTGAGVALGVLSAIGLTRLMSSLLFGVSPMDPITYAAVSVALGVRGAGGDVSAGPARVTHRSDCRASHRRLTASGGRLPARRGATIEGVARDFDFGILQDTAHRPWPMPQGPWFMTQSWNDLLFAHWAVPPSLIAATASTGHRAGLFDGRAWISVVPFWMSNVTPRGVPPMPWMSTFPELNVRTYVTVGGKRPGVYFFSLDATNPIAVAGGARGFQSAVLLVVDPHDRGAGRQRRRPV